MNTRLRNLDVGHNQLTELDISQNVALNYLGCNDNQLTSLEVFHIEKLLWLDCRTNSLDCIQVNQLQVDKRINRWVKDDTASYSLDCDS